MHLLKYKIIIWRSWKTWFFFLCSNQMNQVSIYREKKSRILVKIKIKNNFEWNNWVEIIKMIKIQTANQNQPRITHYPQRIFSLRLSCSTLAPVDACCTHAMVGQRFASACPCGRRLNIVECVRHFSPPCYLSTPFNIPLKLLHMLKVLFNTTIGHGLKANTSQVLYHIW